jgi:NADH-quinone oxidoreductase subunit D
VDTEERTVFSAASEHWMVRGGGIDIEVVRPGDLRTEEMILNIGPQHPSTHGVLRLVLELDGEVIVRADPVIGYMHRAAEKLAEHRDARQTMVLMNRHDWLSAFNNELGWTIAVERMLGIEVPERAQWIRTMMAELNRILSHLMFMGSYPLELGAMTPMFYAFREREMVQGLMEAATGARMHHSYCRVGGLKDDLPKGFVDHAYQTLGWLRKKLVDFDNLIMGNEIIHARTKGVGVLPPDVAVGYGVSGPVLHASGVAMDPRKDEPYEKYGECEFQVPVGKNGDCFDRLWVLVQRMHQSCDIVEQCLDSLESHRPEEHPLGGVRFAEGHGFPGGRAARIRPQTHRKSGVTCRHAAPRLPGLLLPARIDMRAGERTRRRTSLRRLRGRVRGSARQSCVGVADCSPGRAGGTAPSERRRDRRR